MSNPPSALECAKIAMKMFRTVSSWSVARGIGAFAPGSAPVEPDVKEDISIGVHALDVLFLTCVVTATGVFGIGNLLLMDGTVLVTSVRIWLVSIGLLFLCHAVSRATESLGWGLALTYAGVGVVAVDGSGTSAVLMLIICAISLAYLLAGAMLSVGRQVFASASLGVAAILGCNSAYTSFDILQRVSAGHLHQDTGFHASIASMLKNYGVASTGLNGLIETPYHVFSHLLIAGISRLSGEGVLEVYGVAPWVLFAPMLLLTFASFCLVLQNPRRALSPTSAWAMTSVLLALAPFFFSRWALWNHFFISESYLISLGMFLAGMPLLLKKSVSWEDAFLVVLLSLLLASAKTSVGLIFVGLWLVRAVMWRIEVRLLATAAVSLLCVAWIVSDSASANSGTITVRPLDFIRASSLGRHVEASRVAFTTGHVPSLVNLGLAFAAVMMFVVVHFWASWAVVAEAVRTGGWRRVLSSPIAVYSLAAVLAGLVVVVLFAIPGGSAGYFTTVAFFVSAPAVLVIAGVTAVREIRPSYLWGASMIVLLAVGAPSMYIASAAGRPTGSVAGAKFVDELRRLRSGAPTGVVFAADARLLLANPTTHCRARPFIFPAISERPWTHVIEPVSKKKCEYVNFGFGEYNLEEESQTVSASPVLPKGGRVIRMP